MREFFVRGTRHTEQEMSVFADSPQEAAKKFRDSFPNFNVNIVATFDNAEWEAFARCEGCGVDLFIGDYYRVDSEGLEFCESCATKAEDSQ